MPERLIVSQHVMVEDRNIYIVLCDDDGFYIRINGVRVRHPDQFVSQRKECAYQWWNEIAQMYTKAASRCPLSRAGLCANCNGRQR